MTELERTILANFNILCSFVFTKVLKIVNPNVDVSALTQHYTIGEIELLLDTIGQNLDARFQTMTMEERVELDVLRGYVQIITLLVTGTGLAE